MAQPISVPADVTLPELTFRGVLLGALITVIFTASNVFRAEGRPDLPRPPSRRP